MATLEKIRNQAALLVIIVGLALFAFVIGDFLNSGSTYFRQNQDQVINVNGKAVHYQEYIDRIEEMTKIYRLQSNTNSLTEEQTIQIRQNVYDALVNEIILNEELEKIGLTIVAEELFDMVQGENISPMAQQFPYFADPETGYFDKMRALNILKTIENIESAEPQYREEIEQVRDYWLFWERNMKTQGLQTKYLDLLSKVIVVNPLEAKDAFDSSIETSDIVYAMQSFATIPDSTVVVSDSDIRKMYNQRKEQFKQKESRIFDYIAVDINPSQEDYEQVQREANRVVDELAVTENVAEVVNAVSEIPYWDAFIAESGLDTDMIAFVDDAAIGDIEGPLFKDNTYVIFKLMDKTIAADSVKVSHILLGTQGESKEVMEARADSLMTAMKEGALFETLAAQYSMDRSGQNGGEIGWMTELDALNFFGEEFKNAVFAASINQPFVLSTTYGVHVLRVTEKTADVPKYKLAYVRLSVTPSTKTYTNLYNEFNQFISSNNTVEKMTEAATDAGYRINSNVSVTGEDRFIGAVPDARQVIRWLFENKKKNEISGIFECRNHFVVAVRRDVLPDGYQSIENLTPALRMELVSESKGEKIAQDLKAKNLNAIYDYAQAMGTLVDTVRFINFTTPMIVGIGVEPKLNAAVAFSPMNQVGGPIVGNNGVYVFSVFNRSKENNSYDEQSEIYRLESEISYRVGYAAFQSLMEKSKIEDNRIRFE